MTDDRHCAMPMGGPMGPPGDGPPGGGGLGGGLGGFFGGPPTGGPPPAGGGPGGPPPDGGGPGGSPGGGPGGGPFGGPPTWYSGIFSGGGPPRGGGPPGGAGGNFGLHTVNTTARPGHAELLEAEAAFARRFKHAIEENSYDPFLDFSTVLYAASLDLYLERFLDAGFHQVLLLAWKDDGGSPYFSLLAHACGAVIVELVSATGPSAASLARLVEARGGAFPFTTVVVHDPLPRLPASVFSATGALDADPRVLTPLAVSKGVGGTDTLAEVDAFYTGILAATKALSAASAATGDELSLTSSSSSSAAAAAAAAAARRASEELAPVESCVAAYQLPGANALVRFTFRAVDPFAAAIAAGRINAGGTAGAATARRLKGGTKLPSSHAPAKRFMATSPADRAANAWNSAQANKSSKVLAAAVDELSVDGLEALKHSVRAAFHEDRYCGVDKFYDNHFAWDQQTLDLNGLVSFPLSRVHAALRRGAVACSRWFGVVSSISRVAFSCLAPLLGARLFAPVLLSGRGVRRQRHPLPRLRGRQHEPGPRRPHQCLRNGPDGGRDPAGRALVSGAHGRQRGLAHGRVQPGQLLLQGRGEQRQRGARRPARCGGCGGGRRPPSPAGLRRSRAGHRAVVGAGQPCEPGGHPLGSAIRVGGAGGGGGRRRGTRSARCQLLRGP